MASLILNGTFMLFFRLGLGGKMSLIVDAPDITAHERRQQARTNGQCASNVEDHVRQSGGGVCDLQCRLHATCWLVLQ